MEETALPVYFGEWIKSRRKELDLTQAELAQRASCSVPAVRKIEAGVRRPSRQLAGLLAKSLEIPTEDQTTFIKVARGELSLDRLSSSVPASYAVYRPAPLPRPAQGNLPRTLTPFIGREPELTALSQLLRDPQCRLLTLVGPGGIGKTRLAIEVASYHQDLFPDSSWFVPLAPLNSSEYLIPAIADALNFSCHGLTNPHANLLNYLRDKQTLLVLDNIEHLLDGVGLFAEILENCPQVKMLVTGRERLNLLSEWIFEIQGLPVPSSDQVNQFEEYGSVALFLQSAQRIRADFKLREEDRPWVAHICQIMEGMPLGIELAAAWVGVLSCEEIAKEIERNLDFLAVSMRDIPERHRSLRATLDYSWNLLNPEEKTILSRLSVFQGSFRREAAQEICGASLTLLSSLKDKSLLQRTDQGRYDLHELIHQYAGLRLAEDAEESERINDQHALYFARRMSEWEKALKTSKQVETLSEIVHEIDNLRQAWQRLVTCSISEVHKDTLRSPSLFHSSLFSLSLFYEMRCRNREAISLFGQSVECLNAASGAFDSPEDKWFYETVLGHVTMYLGLHYVYVLEYQKAQETLEEALFLLEKSQAKLEKAQAQVMLAWSYHIRGQVQKAIVLLEDSLATFQAEGDRWWYALGISHLAWAYLSIGDIRRSEEFCQEGFRLVEPGDLRLGIPLRNGLARARYLSDDYVGAERLLRENLELSFQLGSKRQTAVIYLDLGQVALANNQIDLAEMNFQECIDLLSAFGESHDLAFGLIYSGKCLTARGETEAARRKFLRAVQIGQALEITHLIYWGLVNIAWIYMRESEGEKALEIALVLQRYPVEIKKAQDDGALLMTELKSIFTPQQVAAAADRMGEKGIEHLLDLINVHISGAPDLPAG